MAILKWPIPLANFYLNSCWFLGIVANSSNQKWPILLKSGQLARGIGHFKITTFSRLSGISQNIFHWILIFKISYNYLKPGLFYKHSYLETPRLQYWPLTILTTAGSGCLCINSLRYNCSSDHETELKVPLISAETVILMTFFFLQLVWVGWQMSSVKQKWKNNISLFWKRDGLTIMVLEVKVEGPEFFFFNFANGIFCHF